MGGTSAIPALRRPSRNSQHRAFEGAEVAPVVPPVRGFEKVDVGKPRDGRQPGPTASATITFTTPGWHRIKATARAAARRRRSARTASTSACPLRPRPTAGRAARRRPGADAAAERPGGRTGPGRTPRTEPTKPGGGGIAARPTPGARVACRPRPPPRSSWRCAASTAAGSRRGLVGVSWRVWTRERDLQVDDLLAEARPQGRSLRDQCERHGKSSATVRLARGAAYRLRLTVVDLLGQQLDASNLGNVRCRPRSCVASSQSSFSAGSCSRVTAAAAPNPATRRRSTAPSAILQEAQNLDGGFGGGRAKPSQSISAWVALALAAAGINRAARQGRAASTSTPTWSSTTTKGSKKATALPDDLHHRPRAGTDGGQRGGDQSARLRRRRPGRRNALPCAPTTAPSPTCRAARPGVNDTIFADLRPGPVEEPEAQAAIQRAADWIESASRRRRRLGLGRRQHCRTKST